MLLVLLLTRVFRLGGSTSKTSSRQADKAFGRVQVAAFLLPLVPVHHSLEPSGSHFTSYLQARVVWHHNEASEQVIACMPAWHAYNHSIKARACLLCDCANVLDRAHWNTPVGSATRRNGCMVQQGRDNSKPRTTYFKLPSYVMTEPQ